MRRGDHQMWDRRPHGRAAGTPRGGTHPHWSRRAYECALPQQKNAVGGKTQSSQARKIEFGEWGGLSLVGTPGYPPREASNFFLNFVAKKLGRSGVPPRVSDSQFCPRNGAMNEGPARMVSAWVGAGHFPRHPPTLFAVVQVELSGHLGAALKGPL